jgi:hypothetical protein
MNENNKNLKSKNVRIMHIINKIAISMFVVGLLVMLYRTFIR